MAVAGGGLFGEAISVLQGLGTPGSGSSGAKGFFSASNPVNQILMYNVIGQALAPLLAPFTQVEANFMNQRLSVVPLSPAELALGVLRGDIDQDTAATEAQKSGTSTENFDRILLNTGEPISIEQALFLQRRGYLDQAGLEKAVRQSRVRDEWIPAIEQLNFLPITASDAVDAAVQNQLTYTQAQEIALQNGIQPPDFETLYNTRGRPPGPSELLEMVRRGIIPQGGTGPGTTSLDQGISESAIKDKWIPVYHALLEYLPPPRTITALERQGVITPTQAQQMYQAAGLTPALAAVYSSSATTTKLARAREITESQILSMYQEQFITAAVATTMLEGLGYTTAEVETLLHWEDAKRQLSLIKGALSKIQSLYVSRRIGTTSATNALNTLGVSAAQQEQLLTTWSLEQSLRIPQITAAQIGAGVAYQVITADQGLQALGDLGYTPWDAWFYLSQHLHQALPNPPPMDTPTGQLP